MKIKELIRQLSLFDPEEEIFMSGETRRYLLLESERIHKDKRKKEDDSRVTLFIKKLKEYKLENDITYRELSDRVGNRSYQSIHYWFRGLHRPHIEACERISKILGFTI